MTGTMRWAGLGCVALAAFGVSTPSAAKKLCGTLSGAGETRFYLLEKVKTKPGSYGPVHGYFVTASGQSAPFSGHYAMYGGDSVLVSVSEGVSSSGFGFATRLHNFDAPLSEGPTGSDYPTLVDGNSEGVFELEITSTQWVDCDDVPPFLATD